MFGITGVGAPSWSRTRTGASRRATRERPGRATRRTRGSAAPAGWLRVMRLDVWVSLRSTRSRRSRSTSSAPPPCTAGRATACPPASAGMLSELTLMYTPVLGQRGATWFIVTGVFAVLYSTRLRGHRRQRAHAGRLPPRQQHRPAPHRRRPHAARSGCSASCSRSSTWRCSSCIKNPVKMVITSGFVQALTLPMIAAAAVYLRYKRTDPRLRPGDRCGTCSCGSRCSPCCATATYGIVGQRAEGRGRNCSSHSFLRARRAGRKTSRTACRSCNALPLIGLSTSTVARRFTRLSMPAHRLCRRIRTSPRPPPAGRTSPSPARPGDQVVRAGAVAEDVAGHRLEPPAAQLDRSHSEQLQQVEHLVLHDALERASRSVHGRPQTVVGRLASSKLRNSSREEMAIS